MLKIKSALIILLITAVAFVGATGCVLPFSPPALTSTPTQVPDSTSQATIDQAWTIIHQQYVDTSQIDNQKMSGAAIKGMLTALADPYSTYLDPETYRLRYLPTISGSFSGIGATVSGENNTARVVSTQPGSPAEKAGIKPGDIILAVDGVSVQNMSLTEVIIRVRGPAGSTVKITVSHQGETASTDINVVRADIKLTTVRSEMRGSIAVITIESFADTTDAELIPVLTSLPQQKATGIVLDLRSNPGGPLVAVVDVASHFLKPGDLVVDVVEKGQHSPSKATNTNVTTGLPMVVLVNNDSASASEVLTGALKDYKRATVAGTKTFGKGSVDIMFQLQDGSAMYLTVGRWLTPKGQLIEGQGIEPDISLTLDGDAEINWAVDYLTSGKTSVEQVPAAVYG